MSFDRPLCASRSTSRVSAGNVSRVVRYERSNHVIAPSSIPAWLRSSLACNRRSHGRGECRRWLHTRSKVRGLLSAAMRNVRFAYAFCCVASSVAVITTR